jgi:DNA-binding IclR family transcriptional regulator
MAESAEETGSRHTIPVIDRMMEVLGAIEHSAAGLTIREITQGLGLPRTSIYRILNTLQQHEMVRRDERGGYHLGRRLLALAAHVAARGDRIDVAAISQPFMDRLAADLGEGIKLSVLDTDGVLVLAAAQGRREYALTVAPGQRAAIHAGAASKLLLAHLRADEQAVWLARPLAPYTPRTFTEAAKLRAELSRIRRQGWAQDRGETAPSILAFAAPVRARDGRVLAALSVPFLAGTDPGRMEDIRRAAIAAARSISEAMPD